MKFFSKLTLISIFSLSLCNLANATETKPKTEGLDAIEKLNTVHDEIIKLKKPEEAKRLAELTSRASEAIKAANIAYMKNQKELDEIDKSLSGESNIPVMIKSFEAGIANAPVFAPLKSTFEEIYNLIADKSVFPGGQRIDGIDFITWLSNGVNSNVDKRNLPLLIFAINGNKPQAALTLIRYGAENLSAGGGKQFSQFAEQRGQKEVVEALTKTA